MFGILNSQTGCRLMSAAVLASWAVSLASAEPPSKPNNTNTQSIPTAGDPLAEKLGTLADEVTATLKRSADDSVAVGNFAGPARIPANAGPGIVKALTAEFKKRDIRVTPKAKHELRGDYLDVIDKETGLTSLHLKTRLMDQFGDTVVQVNVKISDIDVMAKLLALTFIPDPAGTGERARRDADRHVRDAIDNPQVAVRGTRVAASRTSPYGMEVTIQRGNRFEPREPNEKDGLAYVPIHRGEVYRIRLYNDADQPVAVELLIDGLSMFSFCDLIEPDTGKPRFSRVIIEPHSNGEIVGWFRNLQKSQEFLLTDYAGTAVAELGASTESIGTITARFVTAWGKGQPAPGDEFAKVDVDDLKGLLREAGANPDDYQLYRIFDAIRQLKTEETDKVAADGALKQALQAKLDLCVTRKLVPLFLANELRATLDRVKEKVGSKSYAGSAPGGSKIDAPAPTSAPSGGGPDGTGRGKEVNKSYQTTQRNYGRTRACISVRYSRQ